MRRTSPPGGFSLIEVLVVVAIAGIALAAVSLSVFQSDARRLGTETERFSVVVSATADRAALLNRPHRILITPLGYEPQELFRGGWRGELRPPLQLRAWASGVQLLSGPEAILIDRSGLVQPSQLTLALAQQQEQITVDGMARVLRSDPRQRAALLSLR